MPVGQRSIDNPAASKTPFRDYRLIVPCLAAWGTALAIIDAVTQRRHPPLTGIVIALIVTLIAAALLWPTERYEPRHSTYSIGSIRAAIALTLITAALAGFSALLRTTSYIHGPLVSGCRTHCELRGDIDEEPSLVSRGWLTRIRPHAQPDATVILITAQRPDSHRGDHVIARGHIEPFGTPPVIGLFKPQTVSIIAVPARSQYFRSRFLTQLEHLEGDMRGLIAGMSIGDSSEMSPQARHAMRLTSTTHLTAISGTHLGIIIVTLHLFTPGRPRSKILLLATIIGLLIVIVGPRPSIIRAASMAAVLALAHMTGRATQAQTSLAVVVIGWIIVNPWLAVSVGFTLSVAATAAVLAVVGQGQREESHTANWRQSLMHRARTTVAIPLAATVATAPVIVTVTGYFPVYSVLANVLVLPAVAPTTIAGLACAVCANIWPSTAWIPLAVSRVGAAWILTVSEWCSALPYAAIGQPGATWIAIACGFVPLMWTLRRVLPLLVRHWVPQETISGIK